ncbi:MAG: ArsR family transcription regulator [archaeon GW2011_AR20]|nr:MAG: ArsR family transcription regulator [archaeon GW2011_AR20]MBS3160739.1 nucleotidyltransferase [Candidatus Woesearchaeota archaeon]
MVVNLESQNELFLIIGKELKKRVECYAIGESAMIYHGAKRETKDIDLVFSNERDQKEIVNLLKRNGFKERLTRLVYIKRLAHLKKQSPIMLEKDEFRIDLFNQKVICFYLTKEIENRVTDLFEFGNLFVKIISPEDIILLKCATERAGDRIDALELIKLFKINWDIIINESVEQTKLGENIFPVFLYDFLLELKEDLKAEIPNDVLKKLMEISEKELSKRLKK